MNVSTECGSANTLYCELCDFIQFPNYTEFHVHHLRHIRQPVVRLVKLNQSLVDKLRIKCYKINTGVARRSQHVSPLKISLKKNQGTSQFQVIKKEKAGLGNRSPSYEYTGRTLDFKIKTEGVKAKPEPKFDAGARDSKEVEGKNLLERFGANISITRKGAPVVPKIKDEPNNEDSNSSDSSKSEKSVSKSKAESLLERFQGIPGLSISKPKTLSTNGNSNDSTSSGVSVASKPKSIDISQLKKLKEDSSETDKKTIDKNKLLERLSGLGGISIAPKKVSKPESPPEKEKEESEEESKDEDDNNDSKDESQNVSKDESVEEENDQRSDVETSNNASKLSPKNGSQDGYESSDSKTNLSEESNTAQTEEKEKSDVETEKVEPRKFIRVKNSLVNRRDFDQERRAKISEAGSSSEEQESNLETEKDESESRESAVDILERLTDNLNSSVGLSKQVESAVQPKPKVTVMDEANLPPSPTPSEQLHPDFIAPPSECGDTESTIGNDSQFSENTNIQNENQPDCSMMMTPPNSTQDSSEATSYSNVNNDDTYQSKDYDETPTINDEESDQQDVNVGFSNEEQPTYWTDVRGASDQPQQDPLMTGDGSANSGEMGGSFLHNFLNDSQTSQNNIPPEGSEFMSLERLGHQGLEAQHQQQQFDPNAPDPNAPMEQLSQQVQRMPQPPGPQINVIPQHHMQAPQPPQLHPGMPVSPHNMSPQPPQTYDPMGHMQPPMPPLYQGFNMYNQNFQPQAPQMPPRPPPMLQQMPQRIQPRPFQSMAAIPTRPQRPRAFAMKRNMVRLPGPQEMTPPKVRRMDPIQQRQQQQLAGGLKLPTGSAVTITPPKKNLEANKVANVLASRGITVTPAANRQQSPNAARAQQQQRINNAVINLNSSISITPSSQNRTSGGFAVPGPRRANNPIVNHNVERPERCTTVDLTLDDDPPQQRQQINRGAMGRFSCNQCQKIFTTSVALESHKASHRAAGALAFKCDKCTAQYPTSIGLQQHKLSFHKVNKPAPDLAIPIVDLNHPGARDQLGKCGIYNFLPLSQLQNNSNGFFGIPIINLDSAKEKAVSNLNTLGAGNVFVLGKMKPLTPNR